MTILFSRRSTAQSWRSHKGQWSGCVLCPIGLSCSSHVLGRGWLPCDLLLFGEAPGPSEDALGEPFVGRAGKCLDALLSQVRSRLRRERPEEAKSLDGPSRFRPFIANTIACYPDDGKGGFRPPTKEEMQRCFPRVLSVIEHAHPRGILFLGKVADSLLKLSPPSEDRKAKVWNPSDPVPGYQLLHGLPRCSVYHPSYIMRKGGPRSLEGKRWVANVSTFILSLYDIPF